MGWWWLAYAGHATGTPAFWKPQNSVGLDSGFVGRGIIKRKA
jgi:hypothetical protein